jgi:hypothetical protein
MSGEEIKMALSDTNNSATILSDINKLVNDEKYEEALEKYIEALEKDPNHS